MSSAHMKGSMMKMFFQLLGIQSRDDPQPLNDYHTMGLQALGANPYLPTGYMVSTWWVLKQNTQHGPTGSMLITFDYFYNLPPIHPPKYPPGTC